MLDYCKISQSWKFKDILKTKKNHKLISFCGFREREIDKIVKSDN